MGLINDVFEESLPGVVVGAVATAILMPLVGGKKAGANGASGNNGQGRGRNLMKAAVRGYIGVADRIKEATAESREQFSDLAAEVREERRIQAESEQNGNGMTADEQPHRRTSSRKKSARAKH